MRVAAGCDCFCLARQPLLGLRVDMVAPIGLLVCQGVALAAGLFAAGWQHVSVNVPEPELCDGIAVLAVG
jgi:hypothetical protein